LNTSETAKDWQLDHIWPFKVRLSCKILKQAIVSSWKTLLSEYNFVFQSILDCFFYLYALAAGAVGDYFYYQNQKNITLFPDC